MLKQVRARECFLRQKVKEGLRKKGTRGLFTQGRGLFTQGRGLFTQGKTKERFTETRSAVNVSYG